MSLLPAHATPSPELMQALGRLVRGLSALFWGLPLAIVVSVQTLQASWFDNYGAFGFMGPVAIQGLLLFGLGEMGHFQAQERVWATALERARILAVVNLGLAPFLYWQHRLPEVALYGQMVMLLGGCGLCFLYAINSVLRRLAAMLPDETLRSETVLFTSLNCTLLAAIPFLIGTYFTLVQFRSLPRPAHYLLLGLHHAGEWIVFALVLVPVAMTMSLLWRIKEAILHSVYGGSSASIKG